MSTLPAVDAPDAADSLSRQLYRFDSATRHRGAHYYRNRRVSSLGRASEFTVTAQVAGGMLYEVELRRTGEQWTNSCSCPMGLNCKHVYATALAWIDELAHPRSQAGAAATPPSAPKLTFRQEWEPILAQKLGRDLTAEEGAFLGKLSQIFHNFRQSGSVWSQDLTRLGFTTQETRRGHYGRAFDGWWQTPPRDPLELWQYIAHDIESSGLAVPEFMRPITDTAAVRERLQDRQRRESIQRWTHRFSHLAAQARAAATEPRSETAAPRPLDLRLCIGSQQWLLETREHAEAPWKPTPRAFLDTLIRDAPGSLARLDTTPAVYAFLTLCHERRLTTYSLDLRPDGYGGRELLHRLLTHPLARTLVVDPSGQPLTFSATPLAWQLTRSAQNARDYELALHLPDGALLPPAALHLPGRPDYYLYQSVIYRGPPALDGASATAAIVPAEAVEQPETLVMLRQLGTKLPAEIEARFVTVPLRARIVCALETDYANTEIMVLQLLAVSTAPPVESTWSHQGWSAVPPIPPATATSDTSIDPIYSFDLAAPNAVAGHLSGLKVTYDTYRHRWTRRVSRSFAEEFLAWREALPSGVEVLATGDLATLLGAPVRARVDFTVLENSVHRDWFDLALALKPEDSTLTAEEIALLLKARGKLVRLPGKGWRRLTVQLDGLPADALEAAGFDPETIAESALAGETHRFHTLQLAQSAVADLLPERQAADLRARARTLAAPTAAVLPAGLRAELRPYQREGFQFLTFLSANRLGGVLADDMGLGKTVQTLAWLLWLAEQQPAGEPLRALVVCPKSVVGIWESETARFTPNLGTTRYHPTAPDPAATPAGPRIVIANYTQLRLGASYFTQQRWHVVILDEGQFIKNPTSKVAQVARDVPGEHRLVLTGTPIENRLLDLWSLFAFALPGLLGPQASFKRAYANDNPLAHARLRARVRHFLLRRTKAQVAADLPARTEEEVYVELEGDQAKLYQAELKRARAQLLKVETVRQLDKARFNILASLLRLRQICCHPALVDPVHRDAPSAKLDELLERVEALRDEGHQVLVFSQFVTMLEIIRDRLLAAQIDHLMLTGQTEDRDALVRQFQTDKRQTVFLLSLKAAGFGLNLTSASYVILYDPWWNPAVESQAIDRTHRIGQTLPVTAYRLVARSTIEEKIRALQREKASLAGAIVQEESLASVLDLDSLRQILG
jgi:superfamily II DNA or RNA helicase